MANRSEHLASMVDHRPLLTMPQAQPKAAHSLKASNVSTAVLHLAPHTLASRGNVCRYASEPCIDLCLNRSGRGGILAGSLDDIRALRTNAVQAARIRRTRQFFDDGADAFVARLADEIFAHRRRALRTGYIPAVRLNGTSDIPWERVAPSLFTDFADVRFYDYTKYPLHARPIAALPSNYTLTMSYSGHNADACLDALAGGRNVALVFDIRRGQPLPTMFGAYRVIDGDVSDARFLDPVPCVVGLRLKGRIPANGSPFVIRAPFTSVEAD